MRLWYLILISFWFSDPSDYFKWTPYALSSLKTKSLQRNLFYFAPKQLLFMFSTHALYILVCSKYANQIDSHDQAIFAWYNFFSCQRAVAISTLRQTETQSWECFHMCTKSTYPLCKVGQTTHSNFLLLYWYFLEILKKRGNTGMQSNFCCTGLWIYMATSPWLLIEMSFHW